MVNLITSNIAVSVATQSIGASSAPVLPNQQPTVLRTDAAPPGKANEQGGSPQDAFEEINAAMQAWATGMRFEIDEDTQQLVVSIVDNKSGEVIRQIPSEEVLQVAKMITQMRGQLVNVKA